MPDIDFVIKYARGRAAYLEHHRGPTHGLVVLPLQALLIALGLRLVWPEAPLWPLFLWTLAGCLSHVVTDFGNDYGTQGLWPLSRRRIALDLIPIVDVWLLLIIGGGWWLTGVLPLPRQAVFTGVWAVLGLYVLTRYLLRARAMGLVRRRFGATALGGEVVPCGPDWRDERVTLHPTLFSLNAWRYVVQEPGAYLTGLAWALPGRVGEPVRARSDADQVVKASLQAGLVSAFARWVRRPRVEVRRERGRYQVWWSDMRYESDGFSPFTAYAWLDQNLKLVDEGLGSQRPAQLNGTIIWRRLIQEMGKEAP